MATTAANNEQQNAAQLSWDRRQKGTPQKNGGVNSGFSSPRGDTQTSPRNSPSISKNSGAAATGFSNPREGGNQMSSRNLLAMAKNSDRNAPLGERVRGEVGKQVGGAVGGYLGSVAPGVGTAVGKKGGEIVGKAVGKSKIGKWIAWVCLIFFGFAIFISFVTTIVTLQYICTSNTKVGAVANGAAIGGATGSISGAIVGGAISYFIHDQTVGSFCSSF